MTGDAILIIRTLFGPIWSLFTSWHFPGTNVTPASAGFFLLLANFVLRHVEQFLDDSDTTTGGS